MPDLQQNLRDGATPRGSSHGDTARFLKDRITYKKQKIDKNFVFIDEWSSLVRVIRGNEQSQKKAKINCDSAQAILINVMKKQYDSEEDFDQALLEGVAQALGRDLAYMTYWKKDTSRNSCVCLKVPFFETHIGIARQVSLSSLSLNEKYGHNMIYDHTVVILDDEFVLADATAVNEIKMDNSNCAPWQKKGDYYDPPEIHSKQGPVAQVLLYGTRGVIPCLVRNGVLPAKIDFCILSGRRSKEPSKKRLGHVYGEIYPPPKCLHLNRYSVTQGGEEWDEENLPGLAAYTRVLRNGIARAKEILNERILLRRMGADDRHD